MATALVARAKRLWGSGWLSFCGTATELLEELRQEPGVDRDALPKVANQLSARLREVEPLIREKGVFISRSRAGHGSTRQMTIWFKGADDADDAEQTIVGTKVLVEGDADDADDADARTL